MKDAFPPEYEADCAALERAIQRWIDDHPGSDLRFHAWGSIAYIGPLVGDCLNFLAASNDARSMLEWCDDATDHRCTLLQAHAVLAAFGLIGSKT